MYECVYSTFFTSHYYAIQTLKSVILMTLLQNYNLHGQRVVDYNEIVRA